jgi:ribonuclease P protein component
MLARTNRLSRAFFQAAFTQGKRRHYGDFVVTVASDTIVKIAVVVSKKVSKKAVVRNRLRRQVYTGMRRSLDMLTPASYVVVVQPTFAKKTTADRTSAVAHLLASLTEVR